MGTFYYLFESKGRAILVFTVLLSLAFDLLGSFQLTDRSDAVATELLGAIYGPLYGQNHRVGQKKITVLLINRQTLENLSTDRWPPDYAAEADFAEWAATYRPAAIFMDFYFAKARRAEHAAPSLDAFSGATGTAAVDNGSGADTDGIANLASRLQRIRDSGIPLFTGPVNDKDPDLAPLAQARQVGIERYELPRDSYPVRDSAGRLQGAFALYQVICPKVQTVCPDLEKALKGRDLAIQWGFGASDEIADFVPPECRGGPLFERLKSALSIGFTGFVPSAGEVQRGRNLRYARCSYADSFPIDWLRRPPPGFDPRPFIEDRVVLIGADLGFLADFVNAPLLGSIPGVMATAMALDNLLQSGDKAAHYAGTFFMNMTYRDLLELVLVILGLVSMVAVHETLKKTAGAEGPSRKTWWILQILVVVLVPIGLGLWMSRILSWPAVNVFSIASMGVWSLFLLAHDLWAELEQKGGNASAGK